MRAPSDSRVLQKIVIHKMVSSLHVVVVREVRRYQAVGVVGTHQRIRCLRLGLRLTLLVAEATPHQVQYRKATVHLVIVMGCIKVVYAVIEFWIDECASKTSTYFFFYLSPIKGGNKKKDCLQTVLDAQWRPRLNKLEEKNERNLKQWKWVKDEGR